MSDFIKDGVACISPILAGAATAAVSAPEWVSIICTAATTIVVCGIKIYRLIRDRDKDLKQKDEKSDNSEDKNE